MSSSDPPGTVGLVERQAATEAFNVVLTPTPSNDPNDPLNWNKWRKAFNFMLVLAATLASFTSIMIQPVLWPDMAVDMGLTITQLQHGQSANLAGLATGCALFVPLTVKYGRRSTYIASVAVMAADCWWIYRRKTYAEVIVTSIILGWAGAINETVAQMTIADLFFVHQRGTANAFYQASVTAGAFLTPVAAGYQANGYGWRSCYMALAISQTIMAAIFLVGYEETKYNRVLDESNNNIAAILMEPKQDVAMVENIEITKTAERDQAASTNDANDNLGVAKNTYWQRMRFTTTTHESLWRVFIAPVAVLFLPHVFFTAFEYAAQVCWLVMYSASSPIIFSAPPYLFKASGLGNMLLGPLIGTLLGALYGGPLSDRVVVRLAKRNGGTFEPEMRLHLLLLPFLTASGGMAMFGVTAARGMHWIYPSIGGALFGFGFSAIGDICFTMVIDTYYEVRCGFRALKALHER